MQVQTSTNPIEKLSVPVLLLIALGITVACLFPSLQNDWVNWDDDALVLDNRMVHEVSGESVKSMFTTPEQVGHYHPLTMLSFALDYETWEKEAFGFHLTNLLLHLISVVLVFYFLTKIGSGKTVGLIGAILFGMHPMHVESVAWISGRKDVLYAAFLLASMIAYLRYLETEKTKKGLYLALAILAYAASLLSKSLAFTLPLLLLLLDYIRERKWSHNIWIDKLPFVALTIPAIIQEQASQTVSDSMLSIGETPFAKTIFLGTYNAVGYAGEFIAPINLSAFHPLPFLGGVEISTVHYLSAIPFLAGMYIIFKAFKKNRPLFFGTMFYLIAIAPVLMILPVGKAISSERYTYVAYIGLAFYVGYLIQKLLNSENERAVKSRRLILGIGAVWLLFLGIQSFRQSQVWKNGETLWTQVIERYPEHYWGYMSRGTYRMSIGEHEKAYEDLQAAVKYNSSLGEAYYHKGLVLEALGRTDQAFQDYTNAINRDPSFAKAHVNRGSIHMARQAYPNALADFNNAVKADSAYALAYLNRGIAYKLTGEKILAINDFTNAIQLEPWNTVFLRHRGVLHEEMVNYTLAFDDFNTAVQLDPNFGESYYLRSRAHFLLERSKDAIRDAKQARKLGFELPDGYMEILENNVK